MNNLIDIIIQPRFGKLLFIENNFTKSYVYEPFEGLVGEDWYIYEKDNKLYKKGCNLKEDGEIIHYDSVELELTDEFQEVRAPYFGSYTISETIVPHVLYQANPGYTGYDDIVYIYKKKLKQKTFNVLVKPPISKNKHYETLKNESVEDVLFGFKDVENLKYLLASAPSHGDVTIDPITGSFKYVPHNAFAGNDSFQYKIKHLNMHSKAAMISLKIKNTPPVSEDVSIEMDEDAEIIIDLPASDRDNDTLTYKIESNPQHGTLEKVSSNQYKYVPKTLYFGQDSFQYSVDDGDEKSDIANCRITINHINHAPSTESKSYTIKPNKVFKDKLIANDLDKDDILTYHIDAQPKYGTVTLDQNTGEFEYTPLHNTLYDDEVFTFYVEDNSNSANDRSNVSSVAIKVYIAEIAWQDPKVKELRNINPRQVTAEYLYNDPEGIFDHIEYFKSNDPDDNFTLQSHDNVLTVKINKDEYTKEEVGVDVSVYDIFGRVLRTGNVAEFTKEPTDLKGNHGDPRFNIQWDTNADIDLYVTNPHGETISYSKSSDSHGGKLDHDDKGGGDREENIVWEKKLTNFGKGGPKGKYQVYVKSYNGSANVVLTSFVNGVRDSKTLRLEDKQKSETFEYIKE